MKHYANATPARLYDLLTLEGGWWTLPALADMLNMPAPTVRRSLYRLQDRGQVRSRLVEHSGTTLRTLHGGGAWSVHEPGTRIEVRWRTPTNEWSAFPPRANP